MKIILAVLLLIAFLLAGCSHGKNYSSPTKNKPLDYSTNTTSSIIYDGEVERMSNCMLFVNGKDITNGNFVKINHQYRNTELPLLAILEELGATIRWKDATTVTIKFGKVTFDLDATKEDFGIPIPPGTTNAVRKQINDELQMDGNSAQGILLNIMGAKITVDYDASIIYINTIE